MPEYQIIDENDAKRNFFLILCAFGVGSRLHSLREWEKH